MSFSGDKSQIVKKNILSRSVKKSCEKFVDLDPPKTDDCQSIIISFFVQRDISGGKIFVKSRSVVFT